MGSTVIGWTPQQQQAFDIEMKVLVDVAEALAPLPLDARILILDLLTRIAEVDRDHAEES